MSLQMLAMPGGRAFMPITKVDKEKRLVYGYASTPAKDYDGDTITLDAIKGAVPGYMKYGNIREMHTTSAVGVAKSADVDEKGLYLCAKVVDDDAWKKVVEEVYKGFSIGGNAKSRDPRDRHVITELELVEISLVDRPANPECDFDFFKAVKPVEDEPASTPAPEPTVEQMRAALAKTVEALPEDEVRKAFVAADLQVETPPDSQNPPTPAPEPVAKAAEPTPAPAAPAVPPQPDSEKVAERLLLADDKVGFGKAVGAALEMTDAQVEGLTKMGKNALNRYFANNPQFLEKVTPLLEKTFTRASTIAEVLAKPDPGQAGAAMAKTAATIVDPAAADATGVVTKAAPANAPKGDYGTQEQAGYADPGLQKDAKPRLPLMEDGKYCAARIRAAKGYLIKNANLYSPADAAKVLDAINKAWAVEIEKDTPTEKEVPVTKTIAEMGPDAKDNLRKGLMAACSAINLLCNLDYLHSSLEAEAAVEGDGSSMPGRFEALLVQMSSAVKDLLAEEVDEMLNNEDVDFIAYAQRTGDIIKRIGFTKGAGDILTKAIGDRTGDKGYGSLMALAEQIEKTSTPQTQEWPGGLPDTSGANDDWNGNVIAKAQSMHDLSIQLGAKCDHTAAAAGDTNKAKKDGEADKPGDKKDPPKPDPKEDAAPAGDVNKVAGAAPADAAPAAAAAAAAPAADAAPAAGTVDVVTKGVSVADIETVLKGLLKPISEKVETVVATVDDLSKSRRNPAPPGGGKVVAKGTGLDNVEGNDQPALDPKNPADVLKMVRSRPTYFNAAHPGE